MEATQIDLRSVFDPETCSWELFRRIGVSGGERSAEGAAHLVLPVGAIPPDVTEGSAVVLLLPMIVKAQIGDHLRFVGVITERDEIVDDLRQSTGMEEFAVGLMSYSAHNMMSYGESFDPIDGGTD